MKIWMNGKFVARADANVSVLDHELLYGDGIFEGMRIYGGKVFRLPDHPHRFGLLYTTDAAHQSTCVHSGHPHHIT